MLLSVMYEYVFLMVRFVYLFIFGLSRLYGSVIVFLS